MPFAEGPSSRRAAIINAQIAPVAAPLVSAVPPGTTLRALFITERGEAYVDLSREAVTAHPGGSLNELLTVYTIVDALTVNLPAVTRCRCSSTARKWRRSPATSICVSRSQRTLGLVQ